MTTAQDDGSSAMSAPRPPYFANRVLRLAIKTALAQHCGTEGLALLCVIAMTEDARRYRGPVTFWNEQLLPLVGFAKWERLDRARQSLIDAGWLVYEPGGRHRPGRYRVTIPPDLEAVADVAVDEGLSLDPPLDPPLDIPQRESRGVSTGGTTGVSRGGTFLPVPSPSPIPKPEPENKGAAVAAGDVRPAKASKVKATGKAQEPIPIPAELDTPEFAQAFAEWQEHLRQKRKPMKPLQEAKLLTTWAANGVERTIAAINHSIANGYQGLFEPNAPNNGQRPAAMSQNDPRGNFAALAEYRRMKAAAGIGGPEHDAQVD